MNTPSAGQPNPSKNPSLSGSAESRTTAKHTATSGTTENRTKANSSPARKGETVGDDAVNSDAAVGGDSSRDSSGDGYTTRRQTPDSSAKAHAEPPHAAVHHSAVHHAADISGRSANTSSTNFFLEGHAPGYHAGVRKCPGCKTYAYVTADNCPECGEELQLRPRIIRCRRCGQQASSELVICPHCARDLQPAPSMVWTLGAPAVLVFVFGLVMMGYWGDFSFSAPLTDTATLATAHEDGEPLRVVTPVPADGAAVLAEEAHEAGIAGANEESAAPAEAIALADSEESAVSEADIADANDGADGASQVMTAEVEAPEILAQEVQTEGVVSAGAESTVATEAGAETTPEASAESSPSDIAETASAESDLAATSDSDLRGIGGLSSSRQVGSEGAEPAAETEAAETESAPASTGDELVVRAASAAQGSNGTGDNGAEGENTSPNMSASVVDYDEDADYRLASPVLRGPADGSVLSCAEAERLSWSPVPYMEADESYVLHLGFVVGRTDDGGEQVIWVMAQPRPANMTSWELDSALCNLAPADEGRQWRWWVEVAQGESSALESISPPSEVWGFAWN